MAAIISHPAFAVIFSASAACCVFGRLVAGEFFSVKGFEREAVLPGPLPALFATLLSCYPGLFDLVRRYCLVSGWQLAS